MSCFCKLLIILMYFPVMLFGRNKLYTVSVYKITSSSVRRYLKMEINKAYEYYHKDKKGIYYGVLIYTNTSQYGKVVYFAVERSRDYNVLQPIWGVTYLNKIPIFFIGDEYFAYLKSRNKKTCYMINHECRGVSEPYEVNFRIVEAKSKKKKKSAKQKGK